MARRSAAGAPWTTRHPLLTAVIALVLLTWAFDVAFGDDADPRSGSDSSATRDAGESGGTDDSAEGPAKPSEDQADGGETQKSDGQRKDDKGPRGGSTSKPAASAKPSPDPDPAPHTYLVTRIVDGDTLELGNGQMVRLVGIDTPEVGECGYDRASARLGQLVLGRQVRLVRSDEDRDHYGRLLRYVDLGSMDAGFRLVDEGLAVARYDSRDGYGYHPREPRYIAADRASRPLCPRTSVSAPAPAPGGSGGNCAPGYQPCVPSYPPDVDCADVNGPVTVTGSDPHGLDADRDGTACE